MSIQDNGPWWDGFSFEAIIAVLGTLGTGTLAVAKWLEGRSKSAEANFLKREDWVIDSARDLLKEVRTDLDRVKDELREERERSSDRIKELETALETERARHSERVKELQQALQAANGRVFELEQALRGQGHGT